MCVYLTVRGPGDGRLPEQDSCFREQGADAGTCDDLSDRSSVGSDAEADLESPSNAPESGICGESSSSTAVEPSMSVDEVQPTDPLSDVSLLARYQTPLSSFIPEGQCLSLLLFVSVLTHPLILAYMDGFTVTGLYLPQSARSVAMKAVSRLCTSIFAMAHVAFLVGQFSERYRLFVAPVDAIINPGQVVRTPRDRTTAKSRGVVLAWCTLAALQGTSLWEPAARAVLSVQSLVGPVSDHLNLPSDDPSFISGRTPVVSLLNRVADVGSAGSWAAWRAMWRADEILRDSILADVAGGDSLLEGWAERIKPFDVSLLPKGELSQLPDFTDPQLDEIHLAPIPKPLSTSWIPLPPAQASIREDAPACVRSVRELLLPVGLEMLDGWLAATLQDLQTMNASLTAGTAPADVARCRPPPVAIGQADLYSWARNLVWDCTKRRSECCVASDFRQLPQSHLNLSYLQSRLRFYPDQGLLSHLLEGVRLEADVELHSVLVPHLASLPFGFSSVDKELRRMHALGWYSFYRELPFWPIYLNGQGSAARKLEARYRRTLEGGGPRQPTFDSSGLRAVSLNEASRVFHIPRHFENDDRPAFREWLKQRGLPAPQREPKRAEGPDSSYRFSKWPKERKPQLSSVMRDLAVLRRAAQFIGEPVYGFGDDAKDYFNQLSMACCELHKLGITFLSRGGEAAGVLENDLFFIVEHQLPFGLHCASNVAQRLSDAFLDLFREDLDELEWNLNSRATGRKLEWLKLRLRLQRRSGEPCTAIRRFTSETAGSLPDLPAPLAPSDIPQGYVCPQLRLYSAYMFTDDPQFLVVSPELAKAALRIERALVNKIGLIMAIPEKRSLGSWSKWIGVLIVVGLGLLVIPREKVVRAQVAISATLEGRADFRLYRALCGLLEHLRAIKLLSRNTMYGLYEPHKPEGASRFGPSGRVICSVLMRKQLERWQSSLLSTSSVSVKRALLRTEFEGEHVFTLEAYSDACYADVAVPGIAGYCHGLYWYIPVSPDQAPFVSIPVLELLGVVINVLVLHYHLKSVVEGSTKTRLVLRTDALTSARGLPASSLKSEPMVAVHLAATETSEWRELESHISVAHLFGDANPLADAASRGNWRTFHRLCSQIGVKPHQVEIPPHALALLDIAVQVGKERAALRRQTAGGHDASPSPMDIGSALSCFGGCLHQSPTPHRVYDSFVARLSSSSSARPECKPSPSHNPITTAAASMIERLSGNTTPSRPAYAPFSRVQADLMSHAEAPSPPPSAGTTRLLQPQQLSLGSVLVAHTPRNLNPASPLTSTSTGLVMPALSSRFSTTRLSLATAVFTERQAQLVAEDSSAMGFSANASTVQQLFHATSSIATKGSSVSTTVKDERAWTLWEQVCESHGTSPFRTAEEVKARPERNAHLLACLLLHAFAVGKPKGKREGFIKPDSALAYPLAIVRVFARWGVVMPGGKLLKQHVAGLKRLYTETHGPLSLMPRRAEPMKFSMVRHMYSLPPSSKINGQLWSDGVWIVFIFRRLICFMMHTAFRLGEVTRHVAGPGHYVTFSNLSWRINSVIYTRPTKQQLAALVPNRDVLLVTPPLSKPDQFGEIHCPFPISITFTADQINAAAAVRDVELAVGCDLSPEERACTPLFGDEKRQPYTYATMHSMLRATLAHCYGSQAASLYTWHSFRSGLATALHAAGVEDAMIQLICRWMCPASLHIYRRMGTQEHEALITRASKANIDVIQTANVPRIDTNAGYALVLEEHIQRTPITTGARQRASAPAERPQIALPLQRQNAPPRHDPPPPATKHSRPRVAAESRRAARPAQPSIRSEVPASRVGSLQHRFPASLKRYKTFFKRPSTRRPPVPRRVQGTTGRGNMRR